MSPVPHTPSGWVEIGIRIDPVAHEAVSAILFDLGCTGVTTEDFGDETLKAYFPAAEDLDAVGKELQARLRDLVSFFQGLPPPEIAWKRLKEEDWGRSWRKFFHTEQVTDSLTVVPAWEEAPDPQGTLIIRMDPGPAFGTGQHPTTRLCLEAMDSVSKPDNWSLLDVGTGSGILAIYGAKLGAGKIAAMDIDAEAVRWAERNARLNGVEGDIQLSTLPLDQWKEPSFLVTANLILGTIPELMDCFPRVVEKGGRLILSGLLRDQVDRVKAPLQKQDFVICTTLFQKEWAAILAEKPS